MGRKTGKSTRPRPTKELIRAITGGNKRFLGWVHHGLCETPMDLAYPFLNLDELIIFAGISWRARDSDKEPELYQTLIYEDLSDSFEAVFSSSRSKSYKRYDLENIPDRIPTKLRERYRKVNPYDTDLKDRIGHLRKEDIETLREALKAQTLKHVFEDQHYAIKKSIRQAYSLGQEAEVDPARLKIMGFQIAHKKNRTDEKVVRNYIVEINRIIRRYPRELGVEPVTREVQGTLF